MYCRRFIVALSFLGVLVVALPHLKAEHSVKTFVHDNIPKCFVIPSLTPKTQYEITLSWPGSVFAYPSFRFRKDEGAVRPSDLDKVSFTTNSQGTLKNNVICLTLQVASQRADSDSPIPVSVRLSEVYHSIPLPKIVLQPIAGAVALFLACLFVAYAFGKELLSLPIDRQYPPETPEDDANRSLGSSDQEAETIEQLAPEPDE